jgi:hypothetical protein
MGRRAYYLIAEHDRDSARLVNADGRELTAPEVIALMGGAEAEYYEIILAPSAAECRLIEARNPEDPQRAIQEAGLRMLQAQSGGRKHVLAIHEQEGRFHFHFVIAGRMPERTLGLHGHLQKRWNQEVLGDEPRIRDWEAHRRFRELRGQLQVLIEEQRVLKQQRREAVQGAEPGYKREVARPFDERAMALLEARYTLELSAIHARYEARGSLGSPRHQAEVEQAEHRHTAARRSLDRRMQGRPIPDRSLGRGVPERTLSHGAKRLATNAAEQALGCNQMPEPMRKGTHISLALAAGAVESAIRGQLGASSLGTLSPTRIRGLQSAQILTHALPENESAQALGALARTALKVAQDLATSPPKIVLTLVQGGADLLLAATRKMGQPLPEPLRRAFEAAGAVPVVGVGAKVLQKAVEMASPITPGTSRAPEVDR